jgi:inorganic pyrophosphatase
VTSVNPSNYENIRAFPEDSTPDRDFLINVIIETPRRTRHKYAFNAKTGLFELRSTIPEGLQWPYDYGFVPGTLGQDGDPLDVLFLHDEPTFPGCFAVARLLGIIRLEKNGTQNDRLVSCAKRIAGCALHTDPYDKIDDIPQQTMDDICRFLVEYSEGAGNEVICKDVQGRKRALQAINEGVAAHEAQRK